jgi:hypothetical protein
MLGFILMPIIVYIEKIVFLEKNASKKRRLLIFDFYSSSSLKQQSVGRHDTPLRHIILIHSQPVFALTPTEWWCNR